MNNVLLWLTKQYLRLAGSKFVRLDVITIPGEKEQEVVVFSSDKSPLLGQATLFRTTILNETVFGKERLLNYVVLHETGHRKQWYGYFIYPLLIVCVLVSFGFLLGALWSLLASMIFLNPSFLLSMLIGLLFAALTLAILGIFSWALEINAEFYAIGKLGLQGYLDALADAPKPQKRSLYLKAVILLTHPPSSVVIWIYQRLHKKQDI
jgi:hypothetical protein